MITWVDMIEVFVTTTVVSFLVIPLCRRLAVATGYMDHPKGNKVHAHPTPLLGGVGIYVAFMVGVFTNLQLGNEPRLLGIVVGCTILLVVGLIDDRLGMIPELKLLAQFLAAMAVVKSGVRIEFIQNYYLEVVLTYLWIVGITNAFNLLDNMNGLSAGIACLSAVFFGIALWGRAQIEMAVLSFALAGSCLGFLKHNFPRAGIFMGDSGSLVIGFLSATIALLGDWNTLPPQASLVVPFLILGYPIFDTTLVVVMRFLEQRSLFQGGKDHSSHRLALIGLKKKRTVLVIFAVCAALGSTALIADRVAPGQALTLFGVASLAMIALGIRLAMVGTGRYGRKKTPAREKA